MEIECASVVSNVVVHARGALVTRAVTLPADLPDGVVDIAVPGVTIQAEPGSARAAVEESDRTVASVHTSIVVTGGVARLGRSIEKVRELSARKARLDAEHAILSARRDELLAIEIQPELRPHDGKQRPRDAFDVRFAEAIAMTRLLATKATDLDQRVFAIDKERQEIARELEAARVADSQTSSAERIGESHPTRRISVRLTGEGRPGVLLVTYAVAVARWWPAYTLRMFDGAARATWTFEAFVAQRTGEDWNQALLALSSADLVFDARLPELASLRFGRQQPSSRRPLRAAPAGVEDMFAGYLAFRPVPVVPPQPQPLAPPKVYRDQDEADDEATGIGYREEMKMKRGAPPPAPTPMAFGGGGAPPAFAIPAPQAMMAPGAMPAMPARMRAASAPKGGALGGMFQRSDGAMDMPMEASSYGGVPEPEPEPELVAGAQWQNLDRLVLAGPDGPRRGRLVPSRADGGAAGNVRELDALTKERWIDPSESRGMFDHRYDAKGRADVPSDGRVHRVGVETIPCHVLIAWRTVPSVALEVYREANVINPFDTALLGGPVDVYLDGSLLAETKTQRIDKGGTLWCGMGVDDRVKVARNVRADEESAGLLGGSLAVTHTVGIELSSTIRDPIKVKVLESVPVTDDKAIEVKLLKVSPQGQAYDQANRGAPVRGGYQFDVTVTGGAKAEIGVVYKLVFPSKLDIVGGSRRG